MEDVKIEMKVIDMPELLKLKTFTIKEGDEDKDQKKVKEEEVVDLFFNKLA